MLHLHVRLNYTCNPSALCIGKRHEQQYICIAAYTMYAYLSKTQRLLVIYAPKKLRTVILW